MLIHIQLEYRLEFVSFVDSMLRGSALQGATEVELRDVELSVDG